VVGLSIAHIIVEAHNGQMFAETKPAAARSSFSIAD
jgi:signal transduction histidine kinase